MCNKCKALAVRSAQCESGLKQCFCRKYLLQTRSYTIAEGPRDASCQLKFCQLPGNSAETTCTTSPEQIKVMKLEGYSGLMCNKHVHSTMTPSSMGLSRSNFVEIFGTRKLESLSYRAVLFMSSYV